MSFERLEATLLRAEGLRAQGFFERCEAPYRRVLAAGPAADPGLWLEAALGLTAAWRSLGRTRPARRILSQASSLARRRHWTEVLERVELEEALLDRAEGRYGRCLPRLERIFRRALAGRDWQAAGFLRWATGGARRFSGDLKGGERDFREARRFFRRAKDPEGEAYALFGLGGVTRILGRLAESERHYAEAGRRLKGTSDLFGRAYAHCGLANALRQRGRWGEAWRNYQASHALYSRLEDWVDLAYVDWGLGQVSQRLGRLKEAEALLRKSLVAFHKYRETRGEVLALDALASLRHSLGKTAEAEKLFDRAVRLSRRAGLHAHLESFT